VSIRVEIAIRASLEDGAEGAPRLTILHRLRPAVGGTPYRRKDTPDSQASRRFPPATMRPELAPGKEQSAHFLDDELRVSSHRHDARR
jgi:hypothetical protein